MLLTMRRLDYPFERFVGLMRYMTEGTIKSLAVIPPPHKYKGIKIAQDLQGATFGTLTQLQQSAKGNDYMGTCCKIVSVVTGIAEKKVPKCKAVVVLGIVNMVKTEMERIGKLFQSLNVEHTSDELAAGIESLDFGAFGIVDWYAQRMGIIDHEEVFNTPWARIFQCMRIDHDNSEFEKRYRRIIENRSKIKR